MRCPGHPQLAGRSMSSIEHENHDGAKKALDCEHPRSLHDALHDPDRETRLDDDTAFTALAAFPPWLQAATQPQRNGDPRPMTGRANMKHTRERHVGTMYVSCECNAYVAQASCKYHTASRTCDARVMKGKCNARVMRESCESHARVMRSSRKSHARIMRE